MPQTLSYEDIVTQCKKQGVLYEDPDFPACDSSIFFSREFPHIEWKRPKDIVDKPQWISGGASRFDVQQGMLGDCWLVAPLSALACYPSLFARVVDSSQSFDSDYHGVFKFKIWREGEWKEVVVDDRLPLHKGKLLFMHSAEKNEFWSSLLEKAFAKLSGSYESLKGGQSSEAMCAVTGGVSENYKLDSKNIPKNLFGIMLKAQARQSLVCCSINAKPNEIEARLDIGLVKGHAYTITGARKIQTRTRAGEIKVELVRVRNPWGNEREWEGPWGDRSNEWTMVSEEEKKRLGLTYDDDGEFWMSFDDWSKYFDTIEICNLGPDSLEDQGQATMASFQEKGGWVRGHSAGGCRNFINSFASNPQYRIVLTDTDDDDDDVCTVVVQVMQTERRMLKEKGGDFLTIGFTIYEVKEEENKNMPGTLDKQFFMYHSSSARSPSFINSKVNTGRFELPPGDYVVIPSTFSPNEEGEFLIRIFSEKPHKTRVADEPTRYVRRSGYDRTEVDSATNTAFEQMYKKLAGRDMEMDVMELAKILNKAFKAQLEGIELQRETVRSILVAMDRDLTNKLDFEEFKDVWQELKQLGKIFERYDRDNSSSLDLFELRDALKSAGFTVSNECLRTICEHYQNARNKIGFEDFLGCITRMKSIYSLMEITTGGYQRMSAEEIISSCVRL